MTIIATEEPVLELPMTEEAYRARRMLPMAVRLIGTEDVPANATHLSELYQMVRTAFGGSAVPYSPSDVECFPYWDKFEDAKVLRVLHEYRVTEDGALMRPWSWSRGECNWVMAAVATLISRLD